MARPRARLSLKGRALQLLAQRDQSRVELRRKLRRHAAVSAAAVAADSDETAGMDANPESDPDARHAEVEAVLDWLAAQQFLSAERFVESRIHAREGRFGSLRIKAELAKHGLQLPSEAAHTLAESELARASAVRERKFAQLPADAAERARQSRFLAARGFSPEAIHRLMRQFR